MEEFLIQQNTKLHQPGCIRLTISCSSCTFSAGLVSFALQVSCCHRPGGTLLQEQLHDSGMIAWTRVSANADPHTNKLRTRVTHIWGNRRRQPNRSAMGEPLPGETAYMITVFSVPGKYAYTMAPTRIEQSHYIVNPVSSCSPISSLFTTHRLVVTGTAFITLPRGFWDHFQNGVRVKAMGAKIFVLPGLYSPTDS